MRTFEIKGLKVHVEDEEMAKAIVEKEENSEEDAELLLKELEEWLAAGRSHIINKAQKELRKQWVGVGDAAPAVPRGAVVGVSPQAQGAATGIVAAPNLPAWLTGSPQAQAAAQQIAVSSMVEAVVGQLSVVLEEFAAKLAEWVSQVAQGLFQTVSDVAERIASSQEKLGEKLTEVSEKLESVAEKLPAGGVEEEVSPLPPAEAVPPVPEEVEAGPTAGAPAVGPEVPPEVEGAGVGEAGAEEVSPTPPPEEEEEAKSIAAPTPPQASPVDATAVMFSPQFLAAFARHLSQMTKDALDAYTRKTVSERPQVPAQSAIEIADMIASTLRKSQKGGRIETDLTAPVVTAEAPKEGESVAKQLEGAEKNKEIEKPLNEAKKVAEEKSK